MRNTKQIVKELLMWAAANTDVVPELGGIKTVNARDGRITGVVVRSARKGFNGIYIHIRKEELDKDGLNMIRGCLIKDADTFVTAREQIRHYLMREDGFDLVNCEEAEKKDGKCLGVKGIRVCLSCRYRKK